MIEWYTTNYLLDNTLNLDRVNKNINKVDENIDQLSSVINILKNKIQSLWAEKIEFLNILAEKLLVKKDENLENLKQNILNKIDKISNLEKAEIEDIFKELQKIDFEAYWLWELREKLWILNNVIDNVQNTITNKVVENLSETTWISWKLTSLKINIDKFWISEYWKYNEMISGNSKKISVENDLLKSEKFVKIVDQEFKDNKENVRNFLNIVDENLKVLYQNFWYKNRFYSVMWIDNVENDFELERFFQEKIDEFKKVISQFNEKILEEKSSLSKRYLSLWVEYWKNKDILSSINNLFEQYNWILKSLQSSKVLFTNSYKDEYFSRFLTHIDQSYNKNDVENNLKNFYSLEKNFWSNEKFSSDFLKNFQDKKDEKNKFFEDNLKNFWNKTKALIWKFNEIDEELKIEEENVLKLKNLLFKKINNIDFNSVSKKIKVNSKKLSDDEKFYLEKINNIIKFFNKSNISEEVWEKFRLNSRYKISEIEKIIDLIKNFSESKNIYDLVSWVKKERIVLDNFNKIIDNLKDDENDEEENELENKENISDVEWDKEKLESLDKFEKMLDWAKKFLWEKVKFYEEKLEWLKNWTIKIEKLGWIIEKYENDLKNAEKVINKVKSEFEKRLEIFEMMDVENPLLKEKIENCGKKILEIDHLFGKLKWLSDWFDDFTKNEAQKKIDWENVRKEIDKDETLDDELGEDKESKKWNKKDGEWDKWEKTWSKWWFKEKMWKFWNWIKNKFKWKNKKTVSKKRWSWEQKLDDNLDNTLI